STALVTCVVSSMSGAPVARRDWRPAVCSTGLVTGGDAAVGDGGVAECRIEAGDGAAVFPRQCLRRGVDGVDDAGQFDAWVACGIAGMDMADATGADENYFVHVVFVRRWVDRSGLESLGPAGAHRCGAGFGQFQRRDAVGVSDRRVLASMHDVGEMVDL